MFSHSCKSKVKAVHVNIEFLGKASCAVQLVSETFLPVINAQWAIMTAFWSMLSPMGKNLRQQSDGVPLLARLAAALHLPTNTSSTHILKAAIAAIEGEKTQAAPTAAHCKTEVGWRLKF